jgi:hypothetical protein
MSKSLECEPFFEQKVQVFRQRGGINSPSNNSRGISSLNLNFLGYFFLVLKNLITLNVFILRHLEAELIILSRGYFHFKICLKIFFSPSNMSNSFLVEILQVYCN